MIVWYLVDSMSIVNIQKKEAPTSRRNPFSPDRYTLFRAMYERDSVLFVRVKQQENIPWRASSYISIEQVKLD